MKSLSFLLLFTLAHLVLMSQKEDYKTVFENNENHTATYTETIEYYKKLSQDYGSLKMEAIGPSDSGQKLHSVILSKDKEFEPELIRNQKKLVLLINNAIHPGEPCGVDASMMFIRDLVLEEPVFLNNVVIVMIPFYNIGGGLNRGSHSRANQDGPEAYGFRGNSKNLDLNRDFIKCDSKNAKTFAKFYTKWMPDVFIDNHTSNGADYQYTMTLISTQADKLEPSMKNFLVDIMEPKLYKEMHALGWEMTPYVYARTTPDEGIAGFLDLPRYSSGFAALHQAYSFMPETHMLKPYKDRVKSTYAFMQSMLQFMHLKKEELETSRLKAYNSAIAKTEFNLLWKLDQSKFDLINFKGYEAAYKPSQISGQKRLYYDQTKPYEKQIKNFRYYVASKKVSKPSKYVFPQAYSNIADLLRLNGIEVETLSEDKFLEAEHYKIVDFKTVENPYEGHYLHYNIELEKIKKKSNFYKGDFVVSCQQKGIKFIIETLEPQAADSYFAWNFFDSILQQKEYYSDYIFEDLAATILEGDSALKAKFEKKKVEDQEFAKDGKAQLDFIYKHSPHYEPTVNLYPVARIMNPL